MSPWQKIRFWVGLVFEGAGWLSVLWAAGIAAPAFLDPGQALNVRGLFSGLANGFIFLLVGALLMLSLKRCVSETVFLLLTMPAFATCAILLSFYLYAFGGV